MSRLDLGVLPWSPGEAGALLPPALSLCWRLREMTFPMTAMSEFHTLHQGWLTGGASLSQEQCSQERSSGVLAEIFPFLAKSFIEKLLLLGFFSVFCLKESVLGAIYRGELNSVAQLNIASDDCIII